MLFANNFHFIIDDVKLHRDNPEKNEQLNELMVLISERRIIVVEV